MSCLLCSRPPASCEPGRKCVLPLPIAALLRRQADNGSLLFPPCRWGQPCSTGRKGAELLREHRQASGGAEAGAWGLGEQLPLQWSIPQARASLGPHTEPLSQECWAMGNAGLSGDTEPIRGSLQIRGSATGLWGGFQVGLVLWPDAVELLGTCPPEWSCEVAKVEKGLSGLWCMCICACVCMNVCMYMYMCVYTQLMCGEIGLSYVEGRL